MIELERTSVMNFENALRGARNPLSSWAKSDSFYGENGEFVIGEIDLSLAHRLAVSGSDHRKYLRQVFVSVDITAPIYWWKEFDTYKVGTVANSCSTMHKIHDKEFTFDDFSHEHLSRTAEVALEHVIDILNLNRDLFNASGHKDKDSWWQMIQLLPSSYNQTRTVQLNYEVLANICEYMA